LISERDKLLIEAARFYPGCDHREVARRAPQRTGDLSRRAVAA
jgi:hypothetical protein